MLKKNIKNYCLKIKNYLDFSGIKLKCFIKNVKKTNYLLPYYNSKYNSNNYKNYTLDIFRNNLLISSNKNIIHILNFLKNILIKDNNAALVLNNLLV